MSSRRHVVVHTAAAAMLAASFVVGADSSPQGVVSSGDWYVTEALANRVSRVDATGALLGPFGGIEVPGWLTCGPNGNLLVTRSTRNEILEFDNITGANLGVFASTNLNVPAGLTVGPNGNLFVSNRDGRDVIEFDGTTGAFISTFAAGLPGKPFSLAFGANGNLFVGVSSGVTGGGGSVEELDGTTGAPVRTYPTEGQPRGLTFGPDGHVYVTLLHPNVVAAFDVSTGDRVRTLTGGLTHPHGIRFDANGNLFVAEYHQGLIVRFDSALNQFVPFSATGLIGPVGLHLGQSPSGPCGPLEVEIDIKPGSSPNSINLGAAGVIPVAILSSGTFDATTVDGSSISLGGANVKVVGKGDRLLCHEDDVNGDGLLDLVCQVENLTEFLTVEGESIAVLEAETTSGLSIRGEDSIRIVPG